MKRNLNKGQSAGKASLRWNATGLKRAVDGFNICHLENVKSCVNAGQICLRQSDKKPHKPDRFYATTPLNNAIFYLRSCASFPPSSDGKN